MQKNVIANLCYIHSLFIGKFTHLTTPLTSFSMTFLFTETQISSNTNGRDRDGSRAHGKVKAVWSTLKWKEKINQLLLCTKMNYINWDIILMWISSILEIKSLIKKNLIERRKNRCPNYFTFLSSILSFNELVNWLMCQEIAKYLFLNLKYFFFF